MKRIVFIRHAKSDQKLAKLKDFDRPLNKRGLRDAPFMAKLMKSFEIIPDAIISSPAERAITTAHYFAKEFEIKNSEIIKEKELYLASKAGILSIIKGIDNNFNTVFLFGHNPGFTDIVNYFSDEMIDNVPTSGVVGFQYECTGWFDLNNSNSKKIFFEFPKKYQDKQTPSEEQAL